MLAFSPTYFLLLLTNANGPIGVEESARQMGDMTSENSRLARKVNTLEKHNRELNSQVQPFESNDTGFTYMEDGSILAFLITAGIGSSPYERYMAQGYNDDHPLVRAGWNCGCSTVNGSLPCDRHYRSRFLDLWPSSLIDTVRVSVYEIGSEMAYVVFNGRGSTFDNWFTADRVLSSSWTDVKSGPHNYFSLKGHLHTGNALRRFFINRNYGGCLNDRGWLAVMEAPDVCGWHAGLEFPIIHYSRLSTYGNPSDSDEFGKADVLTITVKLRQDVDINTMKCP